MEVFKVGKVRACPRCKERMYKMGYSESASGRVYEMWYCEHCGKNVAILRIDKSQHAKW